MKTLAYIESPYQLINAIAYLRETSKKNIQKTNFILRDNGTPEQIKQFNKVCDANKLSNWKIIHIPKTGVVKKTIKYLSFIVLLLPLVIQMNTTLIGDARSPFSKIIMLFSNLLGKQVVLVDDGLYLLSYIEFIRHRNYTVFTSLPVNSLVNDKYKIKVINSKPAVISVYPANATVFIGMKLVEIGFLSQDFYLRVLNDIALGNDDSELIYYAHREEDQSKLDHVAMLGFKVIRGELPLEELFLRDGAPKGNYYCFYSTAIYNLSRMIDTCHFIAIKPDASCWPENISASIESCYNLFCLAGITIKEIENK